MVGAVATSITGAAVWLSGVTPLGPAITAFGCIGFTLTAAADFLLLKSEVDRVQREARHAPPNDNPEGYESWYIVAQPTEDELKGTDRFHEQLRDLLNNTNGEDNHAD